MSKIDLAKQAEEIGISAENLYELYMLFVEQTESDLIDLGKYISSGDFDNINNCAHHIKGACLNLELFSMADFAVDMQDLSKKEDNKQLLNYYSEFSNLFEELKIELVKADYG